MNSKAARAPLQGISVVVTRAREQSKHLVEQLSALGAEVIECPAISIAPLDDYTHMDRAIAHLAEYDWVIFTSANGVEAFVSRMAQLGHTNKLLCERKLGAIGPATAAELVRAGCSTAFVPDAYVAEAIIEQIGEMQGSTVLLARADIARKALGKGLRQKGAKVEELTAYRTVSGETGGSSLLAQLLQAGKVDAVTFTSSSTVRYTLESLEGVGLDESSATALLNRAEIVCIGPITAATALEHGLRVAKVAETYTSDGLVTALVELFGGVEKKGGNPDDRADKEWHA